MIKVLIVDDDKTSRNGIQNMLQRDDEISIIGSAASGEAAIEFCKNQAPDVILMDVNMPHGMSGFDAAKQIKAMDSKIRILFLTLFYGSESRKMYQNNGFDGYLLKDSINSSEKLIYAVKSVYNNMSIFSPEAFDQINTNDETGLKEMLEIPDGLLSDLEMKILQMVVDGFTYAEIGETLNYSDGYIRSTANKLVARLGLKNSKELAVWGARRGL